MTAVLKNVYIDKLVDIVYEYKNTYHRTIEIKPVKPGSIQRIFWRGKK